MIGTAFGAVLEGIEGNIVQVEADVVNGFPQFSIVGLPDSAVTESKLRIRSAIRNAGLTFPKGRITVNLSPASMRKHGAGLDLAIAIAILRADGQLPSDSSTIAFCAELSLSGTLIPVREAVNLTLSCINAGILHVVIPSTQPDIDMTPKDGIWLCGPDLRYICDSLCHVHPFDQPRQDVSEDIETEALDISDVDGLETAKRALFIAAAGYHHTMLIGPPGSGKTMLANRFSTILPNLTRNETLEVYAIQHAYHTNHPIGHRPPVRSPHHSLTAAGLIGGGNPVHPGEVSYAHNGVLILDEFLEFKTTTLESLREPLGQKEVFISRAGKAIRFPANFILIATTNPCPCGKRGFGDCVCTDYAVQRYFGKLSGPLLDRMDIVVKIEPDLCKEMKQKTTLSKNVRMQIESARIRIREQRQCVEEPWCLLNPDAKLLLQTIGRTLKISRRGLESIIRVAYTISILDCENHILRSHIEEATYLRNPFLNK